VLNKKQIAGIKTVIIAIPIVEILKFLLVRKYNVMKQEQENKIPSALNVSNMYDTKKPKANPPIILPTLSSPYAWAILFPEMIFENSTEYAINKKPESKQYGANNINEYVKI